MRLIANLKNVRLINMVKPRVRCLQIIQSVPHVALCGEDDGLEAVGGVGDGLGGADCLEAREDLGVGEAGEAEDGGAGLDGFDYFSR